MPNAAHIYKAKSGNYNVSFHHPICREGSIGKKIHRGLKVSDETDAIELKRQLDELLTLAETPSLLPPRSNAKYARVVVDAFYDCMTPEPVDYVGLRDWVMPMPSAASAAHSTGPRVLVVGATGVGKSRLIQHLLQTTRENFPMRGAGRTTVSDIEIIAADASYSAAITFFSRNEIELVVRENIIEACAFALKESDKSKIASKLLIDSDKRFRFTFVLGEWTHKNHPSEIEDDDDAESDELDDITGINPDESSWSGLSSCVDQIVSMANSALVRAKAAHPEQSEDENDDWSQYLEQENVERLVDEIVTELEKRLCNATGESSWPVIHRIADTADRQDFFMRLRPYYQNSRKLFGHLVTPLVQGVRVRGRFFPPEWATDQPLSWVLLDGQGVGHEQAQSSSIDDTIPPELASKFSGADIICLVDKAMPSMTGDAPIILEHLLTRGYLERLMLVFTHFEAVNAPDLDARGKRAKVLEGLSNAIQGLALPKSQRVLLEKNAESQSYFLSRLDSQLITRETTKAGIRLICDRIRSGGRHAPIKKIRPRYSRYELAKLVSDVVLKYRLDWSENVLSRFNYKIMEALTNWIGNAYGDGYPKRRLYPGQNLSQRLVSAISIALESPNEWDSTPPTDKEQSDILNAIRSKVADSIDAYCRETMVQDPRTSHWLPAYQNISGQGTQRRRARTVARILEDQAQLPDEGLGKFTDDIWDQIESAITEVCNPDREVPDAA